MIHNSLEKLMRRFLSLIALTGLFLILFSIEVNAQSREGFPQFENVQKVAQSGYQFLKIGAWARAAGLGDAAVTLQGEAATIFINPAGLSYLENISVYAGYTDWFADLSQQVIAAGINLGPYGNVGISFLNMDYGDIQGTVISNSILGYDDLGNLNVTEMAMGLTYARRFSDNFGVGLTTKFCRQDLIERQSSVWAFDVGTIYDTHWNGVKIGVAIQHFSKSLKYIDENFELPLTFRVGFSADLLALTNIATSEHNLNFAFEGVNPRDYSERFHLGFEYWYDGMIALRSGYKFNYDIESFSLGIGFRFRMLQLDYSYSDVGALLGSVNRFSLNAQF
jgi:hypothetical protein